MNFPSPDDPIIETETLTLDTFKVYAKALIDKQTIQSIPNLEAHMQYEGERLAIELRKMVLAEKLANQEIRVRFVETTRFYFPSSVWQHFKRNHAPKWFLRRWPVKEECTERTLARTKTVEVEQFATFPMSPIRMPEDRRGPYVVRYETSRVR